MFWKLKAWYYGRRDGKLGIPQKDDVTSSHFEQRVCAAADRTISAIHKKWQSKDSELSGKYRTCEDAFKRAHENYAAKKAELGRDTSVESLIPCYFILLAIGICEFVVNAIVFQVFAENTLVTWLMAIVILIGLPLVGHHIGTSLRHGWKSLTERCLYPCEIAAAIGCLIYFAIARKEYIANAGHGFLSPNTTICTFIALNLLLFVASIVNSYRAHDEDPHIYKFEKKYGRTQKRFHDIDSIRRAWRDKNKGHAEEVKRCAIVIIKLYRHHNMRARIKAGNKEMPISFKSEPEIIIPSFEWHDETPETVTYPYESWIKTEF